MLPPDLFTVTEAAVVLRVGRTTAYELVRRDFDSGGGEGLAVVRIGGQFRVPRSALEQLVGGPVTWPAPPTPIDDALVEASSNVIELSRRASPDAEISPATFHSSTLPFTS